MYVITDYTKRKAKQLNVVVKSSTNKNKKLDIFDMKGNKLASVGASGYMDYPTYTKTKGKTFADERRRLYLIRHSKDPDKRDGKFTPSYWARVLLW